jgi:hypothetical protein
MKLIKKFESYMSREEMCDVLCRCGYNISELEMCSNQELEQMCRAAESEDYLNNNTMMTQEKKGEKWIKDAIKKPGSLRKSLNKKEGEKISKSELDSELQALKGKDKDPKKKGVQGLSKNDLAKFRKLNLAKTLKGLKEHQETENYMFFGNLKTIKRLVDEMLEMDESEVDAMLSNGHNWALDHIATSKDDVEEVFNFLAGHDVPSEDHGYASHEGSFSEDDSEHDEPSHEETEGHLANNDLEQEMKGIKSFTDFKK